MEHLDLWPVGAEVETIVPLPGHVAAGQDKHGVTSWEAGIRVPAGERGRVTYHIDDGRICCQFDCDEKCGHTFGEPEKFLKLVSVPVEHIDQLRADLAAVTVERDELATALRGLLDAVAPYIDTWAQDEMAMAEAALAKVKGQQL